MTLARIALMLLPLVWLGRRVDLADSVRQASHLGLGWLLAAAATQSASLAVGTLRWSWLLRGAGASREQRPGFLTLLRHMFVGQYFALLPSGLVGEAVRAERVARVLPSATVSYAVLLVDRLAGLAGLALFALCALLAFPTVASPGLRLGTLLGASLVMIGVSGVLVLARAAHRTHGTALRWRLLQALHGAVGSVGRVRGFGLATLASVVTQGLTVLVVAQLLPSTLETTLAACALAVPAVTLATIVPLTPAGLGQRELAFVTFFALTGVHGPGVVSASLLLLAVNVLIGGVGGVLLFFEHMVVASRRGRSH